MTHHLHRLGALLCGALVASALLVAPASAANAKPAAPTGMVTKPTTSAVTITWPAVKGAQQYDVCLQSNGDTDVCVQKSKRTTATKASFSNLPGTGGRDYFYYVRAYNASGSTKSALVPFDLVPGTPTKTAHTVSQSSAKITWAAGKNATSYSVCLMNWGNATTCDTTTPTTATSVSIPNLSPTPGGDWFYVVRAHNGAETSTSAKRGFNLPLGTPTAVGASRGPSSTTVFSWSAAPNANIHRVKVATNSAMTDNLVYGETSATSWSSTKFRGGKTYYYQVRGLNDEVTGPYSATKSFRWPADGFDAVVLTYNLCGQDKCGNVPKWSTRKPLAGAHARALGADIIATQESHSEDTRFGTELPEFTLAAYKSAKSLFVKTSKYSVKRSGWILLDTHPDRKQYAVWAELEDKATTNRFLVTDVHLFSTKGKTADNIRKAQTETLLREVTKINTGKLPVVHVGDWNSNRDNANQTKYPGGFDAPLAVFTKAGLLDTFQSATQLVNGTWNSTNSGKNPPKQSSMHIDNVFTSPEVVTTKWSVRPRLASGLYATPFATDHNAVVVSVAIPSR
jgi:endonuclease/exonuclease/phosphatase family metal-dependent hydrolase